jgi:hypothetical protein
LLRFVCIAVPLTILLFGPEDGLVRYVIRHRYEVDVPWWRQLRTWHWETLAVMALCAAVVLLSGNDPIEWVGFAALTLAHGRNSIMFRLAEAQQRVSPLDPHHVSCWKWNSVYFFGAECCWAVYFGWHYAWSGLVGVGIFLGYGQWRRWYASRPSGLLTNLDELGRMQDRLNRDVENARRAGALQIGNADTIEVRCYRCLKIGRVQKPEGEEPILWTCEVCDPRRVTFRDGGGFTKEQG